MGSNLVLDGLGGTEPVGAYTDDDDIVEIRHDILSFGVASFESNPDLHTEAKRQIDRALDFGWYRQEAENRYANLTLVADWRTYPFDPAKMLNAATQITRLAALKVIELAFAYLKKEAEDNFAMLEKQFREEYARELADVLKQGIDYDWNSNATIESTETKQVRNFRTLSRC